MKGVVDSLEVIREEADSDLLDLLEPATIYALLDAVDLLRRLRQWDALNPPIEAPYGDAPYWVAEMDRVLAPWA